MSKFKVTFRYHDRVKMVDGVYNISSSKKLYCKSPLNISEGFTQVISKFLFHKWESIWYFKKSTTKHPCQPGRWMVFAYFTGDKMCYYISTEGKKL